MAAIIEKQRVVKRAYSKSRSSNKSAGYTSEFMSHFEQRPVRKRRENKSSLFSAFSQYNDHKTTIKIKKHRAEKPRREKYEKEEHSGGRCGGFSFPIPSIPTLAAAAGAVILALVAFNWEDIYIPTPDHFVYQPADDSQAAHHTMLYAVTGVTNVITAPGTSNEIEIRAAQPTETAHNNVQNDENHLITFEWQPYRVRRGDSVSSIAQKFDVSVGAIIASNEIRNARTLQEGVTLRIPNIDGIPYQIKNGDSLSKIAASFNVPLEVILDVNDIRSDNIRAGETIFLPGARMNDIDLRMSLGELFMYPVPSRYVTSSYGMRRDPITGNWAFHTGIDFRADTGTTVVAALDGIVSVVGENRIYGKHIIITHDNNYKTLYAHLNSFSVRQGERVSRGRKIAESGNTGYSTGPHLHFTVYDRNNKLVNPLDLLR